MSGKHVGRHDMFTTVGVPLLHSYITTGYPVVNHSSNHGGSHTDDDDGAARYLGSSRMQDTLEQKRPLPRIAMLGNR